MTQAKRGPLKKKKLKSGRQYLIQYIGNVRISREQAEEILSNFKISLETKSHIMIDTRDFEVIDITDAELSLNLDRNAERE